MRSLPSFTRASGLACISARGLVRALLTVATMASVQAQVTVVSNLGENAWGGSGGLSQHIRYATPFTTDNSANAWTLNSLTVHLDGSDNPSGDFFVEIWSSSSSQPGSLLEALSGNSNPSVDGNYTYTSTGLMLAADTTYHFVTGVSAGTSGTYWLPFTTSNNQTGLWSIGDNGFLSTTSQPDWAPAGSTPRFSISATALGSAIPEPSTYAVICGALVLGCAGIVRRRQRS
jgi:hypothetical protein